MHVFVVGSTGFIGRALVLRLRRDGHHLTAWVRDEERARSGLGAEINLLPFDRGDHALRDTLALCDAVVNLAGEPLVGRWTSARREQIIESRVKLAERIVHAMDTQSAHPSILISGSAVGYYGDRRDEILTEDSQPADDFLGRLCQDWERAACRRKLSAFAPSSTL